MVTSKTAGYIHALIIDTVPLNNSESPYPCALRNQQMVCQELDSTEPEAFRTELVKCLTDYYEKFRDMEGAGGLRVAKSFKRKFEDFFLASSSQTVDGEDALTGEDAAGGALEAGAATPAAPAALEAGAAGAAPLAAPVAPAARADGAAAGDSVAAASAAPVKKPPAPRGKGSGL
jgi:hypothetical protein